MTHGKSQHFRDKINQKCQDAARKLRQNGLGAGNDKDNMDEEKGN